MDFTDKVVLVTGASAGIGEATAILFSKYGAKLSLVGRNEENLRKVAATCESSKGVKPLIIVADLSTDEGVEKTAKCTIDHYGRLDVLVNNAGVGARNTIQHTDMATYDRVFNTNIRGVYNLTRLLVPAIIEAKGNIVNVSSISGSMPNVGSLPYSMTKAALDHFSRCIALELAPLGVRVNTVSPGFTVSEFVKRLTGYNQEQYQSWLQDVQKGIPLNSVAVGDDIAHMIVFMSSTLSGQVTGTVVPVDGGLTLSGTGNSTIMTRQVRK